jgi:chorismate mutase
MTKDIASMRKKINSIDKKIISLLAKRFQTTRNIGQSKQKIGLPIVDIPREEEMEQLRKHLANKYHIDIHIIESIFQEVIEQSKQDMLQHIYR